MSVLFSIPITKEDSKQFSFIWGNINLQFCLRVTLTDLHQNIIWRHLDLLTYYTDGILWLYRMKKENGQVVGTLKCYSVTCSYSSKGEINYVRTQRLVTLTFFGGVVVKTFQDIPPFWQTVRTTVSGQNGVRGIGLTFHLKQLKIKCIKHLQDIRHQKTKDSDTWDRRNKLGDSYDCHS